MGLAESVRLLPNRAMRSMAERPVNVGFMIRSIAKEEARRLRGR